MVCNNFCFTQYLHAYVWKYNSQLSFRIYSTLFLFFFVSPEFNNYLDFTCLVFLALIVHSSCVSLKPFSIIFPETNPIDYMVRSFICFSWEISSWSSVLFFKLGLVALWACLLSSWDFSLMPTLEFLLLSSWVRVPISFLISPHLVYLSTFSMFSSSEKDGTKVEGRVMAVFTVPDSWVASFPCAHPRGPPFPSAVGFSFSSPLIWISHLNPASSSFLIYFSVLEEDVFNQRKKLHNGEGGSSISFKSGMSENISIIPSHLIDHLGE